MRTMHSYPMAHYIIGDLNVISMQSVCDYRTHDFISTSNFDVTMDQEICLARLNTRFESTTRRCHIVSKKEHSKNCKQFFYFHSFPLDHPM